MNYNHTLILAHGAGLGMDSDWLNAISQKFEKFGVEVIRFEFPYMAQRRIDGIKRPPNRLPILLDSYKSIIGKQSGQIFIGGKSMGGRIATMIGDDCDSVAGIIAFGYPFHPPKRLDKLRTEHLKTLKKPCLIVQGTNDPFGKECEWADFNLPPIIDIVAIETANHDLKPLKRTGLSLQDALDLAVSKSIEFMNSQMDKKND